MKRYHVSYLRQPDKEPAVMEVLAAEVYAEGESVVFYNEDNLLPVAIFPARWTVAVIMEEK